MQKEFSYSGTKSLSIFSVLPNNRRMSKYLRQIGFTWAVSANYLRIAYKEPSDDKQLNSLNKKMKEIEENCIDFSLISENPDKDLIFF